MESKHIRGPEVSPRPSWFFAGPSALPLVFALTALGFAISGAPDYSPPSEAAAQGSGSLTLRIDYAVLFLLHLTACSLCIWEALRGAARCGLASRAILARVGLSFAGVFALVVFARVIDSDAYGLSYRIPRAALAQVVSPDSAMLVEFLGLSQYAWMAVVPIALGVLAVIATALRLGSESSLALPAPAEPELRRRCRTLQRSFLMLSGVLVTSTLTAMAFFQQPLGWMGEEARASYRSFSDGITIFWGTVFTLVLVLTFLLPLTDLRRRIAAEYEARADREQSPEKWVEDAGLEVSFKQQFANVLVSAAPLAAGPLGALLQSYLGAS